LIVRYKLCDIIMSPTQEGPMTSVFIALTDPLN